MNSERLITIAIHTYEKAHELKNILEYEGVKVWLQNVNLTNPVISAGIRVRIQESDLPLALRLIENIEIFAPSALKAAEQEEREILVPVDFSQASERACVIAFQLSVVHKAKIKLLHSFLDPVMVNGSSLQLSDAMTFDSTTDEVEQVEEDMELSNICKKQMKEFEGRLREKIKDGIMPAAVFSSEIAEGLPEEVINDYVATHHPMLIVMATRSSDKQSRAMLGSVTAEVLDSSRSCVFTVPERPRFKQVDQIREVMYFASSKQQDILALDALRRLMPETSLAVTLVSLPTRKRPEGDKDAIAALLEYCRKNYGAYTFKTITLSLSNELEEIDGFDSANKIDMMVVPTPRKNIFARLFNPTLAHKLLFRSDIPMLSIPV